MKALLLVAATMAAVSCASEPAAAVRVPAHKLSGEGSSGHAYRPGPPTASDERPPSPGSTTTTTEPETTTTAAPEPTTTEAPYVAPVTTRATTTTVYDEPHPQAHTTRGDTPPDYIKQCESRGDYRAVNSTTGAGGAWQFLPSTWRAVGGTGLPQDASPAEQDYRASILWDGGRGASQWSCA